MALLSTWPVSLFPSHRLHQAGPYKIVFSVTKTFLVKGSGKTMVGCNEGGILPNIDSPAKLMDSIWPQGI